MVLPDTETSDEDTIEFFPEDPQEAEETKAETVAEATPDTEEDKIELSPTDPETEENETQNRSSDPKKRTMVEYKLNGITIKVNATPAVPTKERAYFSKAKRAKLDETHRMKLLEHVQAKQQIKYHSINVSVNDPEKMSNTYTLSTLLAENRRNLAKYDLLDVYNIVKPKPTAFTDGSPDFGALEVEASGQPISQDLFVDYLKLTPEQVAASSKWYSLFVPEANLMQEDLSWSMSYYEKNVEPELYLKVYNKFMRYPTAAQGGPLFLKILLDSVTTTGEQNLKSLIQIVETYRIKTSSPGEDVDRVVNMFNAIFDNIDTLRNGVLPPNSVENLLVVFQSTSVPKFNSYFERFQNQLIDTEIQAAIDPSFQFHGQGTIRLGNNMKSVKHILSYAETHYRNLLRKGEWDECLQKKPGKSAFIADSQGGQEQPTQFRLPSSDRRTNRDGIDPPGECFNCGSTTHKLRDCPLPRDNVRIEANRAKHPAYVKMKERLHKWRPPEHGENNKRVIAGKPHTFNPNVGRRGRWIEDTTPHDGQPNDGNPPAVPPTPQRVFLSEVQSMLSGMTMNPTPSVSDGTQESAAESKLELAVKIANLTRQYESME